MRGNQLQGAAARGIAFNQLAFVILSASACLQTCTSAQCTKYILLTTQRSGSTWTCSVLRSQPHVQCGMHHDGVKGQFEYQSELLIEYSHQKVDGYANATWEQWQRHAMLAFNQATPAEGCRPGTAIGFKLMYDQIPSQFVDEFARWSAKERIYIIHLVRAATVLKMASHVQTTPGHMHATNATELALARRKIKKDGNLIAWGCAKKTTFEDYPFIDESAKRNAARYGQSIRRSPKVILDICDREAVNRHAQEQWDILLELQPGVNYFEIMYEKLLGRTADTYLREILTFLGVTAQVQSPMQHHRDAHAEDAFTKLHESQCGSRFANYSGLLKALAGTRTAAACKFLDAIEEQLELVPTPPSRSNYFATEASQVWHPGVKTPAKTLQWWLLDTRAPHMACYAPKTGSTIWKSLMLYVNTGRNLYRSLRTNPSLVHESSCPGLCESATYRNDAKSAYFDSLPKVIIARNPYDRFLSSYQDWLSRQQETETSVSFGDFVSAVERRDLKGALWNHIDPVSNACGLPGTLNPVPGAYRILRLEEFSLWIEDYIEKFDVKFFLRRLILDLEENSTNRFADSVMNESTTVFSKFEGVLEEKPWSLLEMATTSHMRNSAGKRFNFYTPDIAARVSKLQNADFVHFGYPLWDGLPGSFRAIEEQSDLVPTPQASSTFRPVKGAADAFAVRTSRSAGSGDDGDGDGSGSGSGSGSGATATATSESITTRTPPPGAFEVLASDTNDSSSSDGGGVNDSSSSDGGGSGGSVAAIVVPVILILAVIIAVLVWWFKFRNKSHDTDAADPARITIENQAYELAPEVPDSGGTKAAPLPSNAVAEAVGAWDNGTAAASLPSIPGPNQTSALPPVPPPNQTSALPPVPPPNQTSALPPVPPPDQAAALPAVPPPNQTSALPPVPPPNQTSALPPVPPPNQTSALPPVPPPDQPAASTPQQTCQAIGAYTAAADDQLSFAQGETLTILDGTGTWWRLRKASGEEGMAPSNYVAKNAEAAALAPVSPPNQPAASTPQQTCQAIGAYTAAADDQLSFAQDETLTILDGTGTWWRLRKASGEEGMAPSNYVAKNAEAAALAPVSPPNQPAASTPQQTCQAIGAYTAAADDQLSFAQGETLTILDGTGTWWRLRKASGEEGMAPSNYVAKNAEAAALAPVSPPNQPAASTPQQTCQAIGAYTAAADDQLSFAQDETLTILDGTGTWWRLRKASGEEGMAPSNYVAKNAEAAALAPVSPPNQPAASTPQQTCQAIGAYTAAADDQLSFAQGETLTILDGTGTWWRLRKASGEEGMAPSNYVAKNAEAAALAPVSPPNQPAASTPQQTCQAIGAYTAAADDQLSFAQDETLTILDGTGTWWRLRKASGEEGMAPSNYVAKNAEAAVPPATGSSEA